MTKYFFGLLACALVLTGAGCSYSFGDTDLGEDSFFDDSTSESDSVDAGSENSYAIPEGLNAEVNAPLRAAVGEQFEVTAIVTNNSEEEQLLHSIDVGQSYLGGVAVVSAIPDFSQTFPLDDGTVTHFFEVPVAVGETQEVVFTMEALTEGDYTGDFDVCFDDGISCKFLQVRTLVE